MTTETYLEIFVVAADPETGEWLGEPEPAGEWTAAADGLTHAASEAEHCDTYEPVDLAGEPTDPTWALVVRCEH